MKYRNSILFLLPAAVISMAIVSACQKKEVPSQSSQETQGTLGTPSTMTPSSHEDPDGYWTCSMHPQVHQHEKGKCPICGMDLIHVEAKKKTEGSSREMDSTPQNGMQVSAQQLRLASVSRYTVSRKDLSISLPVSGSLLSSNEVVLQIYESDLGLVKVGSDFSGNASAAPQEELKGKIKSIDPMIDPTSRTLRVMGVLDSMPQKMVSDGGFHGVITTQIKDQLVIPEDSVLHAGTRDLVYLISSDNQIHSKTVVIGAKSSNEYQVFAGLNEGDIISSGPNFLLDSESKIRGGNDQTNH